MTSQTVSPVLRFIRRIKAVEEAAAKSDPELLSSFLAVHDETSFSALVHRHGPMVLAVCKRMLWNDQDAEDAFQATFLVLVRKAQTLTGSPSLAGWLYGVAYRTAQNARRLRTRRIVKEEPLDDVAEVEPVSELTLQGLRAALDDELQRLPSAYRLAIVLCHFEDKTLAQAAQILDCPVGTVSSRLSRGRDLLRHGLLSRGVTLPACGLAATLSASMASASLPASLVHSTVESGLLLAAGDLSSVGTISAKTAILTKGTLKAIHMGKFKSSMALLLAAALLGTGIGTYAHSATGDKQAGSQAPFRQVKSSKTPKPDVQALTVLKRAREVADEIKDDQWKAWLLQNIAEIEAEKGDRAAAGEAYVAATKAARAVNDLGRTRAMQTMIHIAASQAKTGFVEDALATANAIDEGDLPEDWRDHAFALIACEQAKSGAIQEALKTAEENVKGTRRDWVLKEVATTQANAGKVAEADQTISKIVNAGDRADALVAVARAQAKRKDNLAAKKTLNEGLKLIKNVPADFDIGHVVAGKAAQALAEMGEMKEARKTADEITKAPWKDISLKLIAEALIKAGDIQGATQTADAIEMDYQKGEALKNVTSAQLQSGDLKGGTQTADSIKNAFWRITAKAEVAKALARTGNRAGAREAFEKALEDARTVADNEPGFGGLKDGAYWTIARAQAEAGDEREALAWANKQTSAVLKAKALVGIAQGILARKE